MDGKGIDPTDIEDYCAFMDARGWKPSNFDITASPGDPLEGVLSASSRTVTVRHEPSGTTKIYAYRTWVEDLKADLGAKRIRATIRRPARSTLTRRKSGT